MPMPHPHLSYHRQMTDWTDWTEKWIRTLFANERGTVFEIIDHLDLDRFQMCLTEFGLERYRTIQRENYTTQVAAKPAVHVFEWITPLTDEQVDLVTRAVEMCAVTG